MIVCAIDRGDLYIVGNLIAVRGFDVDFPESGRLAHKRQFARLVAVHDEKRGAALDPDDETALPRLGR